MASHRCCQSIGPGEGRTEQAKLHVIERETNRQKREDGENRLAVGVVEKSDHPQDRHKAPAIWD